MSRTLNHASWLLLLSFAGLSCSGQMEPSSADRSASDDGWAEYEMAEEAPSDGSFYRAGSAAAPPPEAKSAPMAPGSSSMKRREKADEVTGGKGEGRMSLAEPEPAADEAPTRAWFPESFLFEPLVVTDKDGLASLEVTVPDQLTDWRVLALAHDRDGGQAGAVARFASTLPVYLDVVEPPTLRVGDVARIPMQVVNNQADPFDGSLSARMTGEAALGSTSGTMGVEPHGSFLQYVDIRALRPGQATLLVDLISTDRVERPVTVVPTGRRLDRAQGGTLAASREFSITTPYGAQPGSSSLSLVVYPGPLAILAEEMGRSLPGAHLQDAAYGFALAGYGRDIALRLGQELDQDALRRSRILAYQRLVRFTRSPALPDAVVALAAARTQPDDELAQALTQRLVDQIVNGQSPDGSFAAAWSGNSASLPRALVMTAMASHWTRGQSSSVAQRGAGFTARNAGYVKDPYTASVLLASGLVQGPAGERMLELVVEAVEVQPDGTRVVRPTSASQRIDGRSPGTVECTAWALLALARQEDQQDLVSDLAAALLGSYRAGRGFGDGLAGLAALEALTVVFSEPLPETVQVRLSVDGKELVTRDMNMAGNFAPLVVKAPAPGSAGPHSYSIEATPAVPGLAFTLTQTAYLPWEGDPGADGFSLKVSAGGPSAVGETLACQLQAAVPGDEPFTVVLELPAGVEVEQRSLQALVSQGGILAFEASEGRLEISAPALPSGAVFDATVELVPTLAGSFHWGGASLALTRSPDQRVQAPVDTLRVALR